MRQNALEGIFQEMGFPVRRTWLGGGVVYSIARTYGLVFRELSQIYARYRLSAASFNLLMLLKHGEDPETFTQHEIGSRLVVSPSDMTGLIDRLERRGFVRRLPGRDRRSKLLRITSQGSMLLDDVWPHHAEAVKRLTAGLKARETQMLVGALAEIRHGLGA